MSTVTRVGTMQTQSFVLEQVSKSTARYVSVQEQISTGQKSQTYDGISDYAAMTVNLANSEATLDQYISSSSITDSRLSAAHNALSNVLDVLSSFRAKLIQGMTADQADDAQLKTVAEGYLDEVESALNTDLGGVFVFGGTKSGKAPVDLSNSTDNMNGTYYSGADNLMQARIDENTVLEYGTTANRQGFKDLIGSLQRVASGAGSLSELELALDDLNNSLDDLTQLEAELGHQMDIVDRASTRNQGVKATVVSQLSSLRDVDVSAATVELTQRETILQASYLVISRSSKLTLTNYL